MRGPQLDGLFYLYLKFVIFTILPSHFLLTWNLSFFDRFLYHIIHDFIFSGQEPEVFSSVLGRIPKIIPGTENWRHLVFHSMTLSHKCVSVCFKFQKTVVAVSVSFNYILTSWVQEILYNCHKLFDGRLIPVFQ